MWSVPGYSLGLTSKHQHCRLGPPSAAVVGSGSNSSPDIHLDDKELERERRGLELGSADLYWPGLSSGGKTVAPGPAPPLDFCPSTSVDNL